MNNEKGTPVKILNKLEKIKVAVYETSEVVIATLITNESQADELARRVKDLIGESDSIVDNRCAKMSAIITMINENIL